MADYRLSFELGTTSMDPSELLDRLIEAAGEYFPGVDENTCTVLELDEGEE